MVKSQSPRSRTPSQSKPPKEAMPPASPSAGKKGTTTDFSIWADAIQDKFNSKVAIKELLDTATMAETRSMLDLLFKVSKSEQEDRLSILQESLYALPTGSDLMETLVVLREENKRLREQMFTERQFLYLLESAMRKETEFPATWYLLFRMLRNVSLFYKRYYESRRTTWISPKRWIEIIHGQLDIGDEMDKDWEGWDLFPNREEEQKVYDNFEVPGKNGVTMSTMRIDDLFIPEEDMKDFDENLTDHYWDLK